MDHTKPDPVKSATKPGRKTSLGFLGHPGLDTQKRKCIHPTRVRERAGSVKTLVTARRFVKNLHGTCTFCKPVQRSRF